MIVRAAGPGDAGAFFNHIQRVFAESGRDGDPFNHPVLDFASWSREEKVTHYLEAWQKKVSDLGWERAWLLDDGEKIVGHSCLWSARMRASAHRCIFGIGIQREARGQGYGTELAKHAILWAQQQKELAWMDLYVFAGNARALALYRKLGFTEEGRVPDQFRVEGQEIEDVRMGLKLR